MNRLDVELTEPNEYDVQLARILVDGRPFLDIIRELETPITAADGQPDLAGTYDYLNSRDVLLPTRQFFGEAVRPLLSYGEKVSILECNRGCAGCWPLLMRIESTENLVIWSGPEQPHRKHWHYPDGWSLVFDRHQYTQALQR